MRLRLFLIILIILIPIISAECNSTQIDINSATKTELMKIKYLGGEGIMAQKVIDARPFSSVEDLLDVKGIGDITLNKIKAQGLACTEYEQKKDNKDEDEIIEETDEEEIIKEDSTEKIIKKEEIIINNLSYEPEITPIDLTKDIKIEENNSEKGTKIYYYGFAFFCGLLIVLYLIKRKQKIWHEMEQ